MLLDLDTIKERFPNWATFLDDDAHLPIKVEEAQRELARYVASAAPLSDDRASLFMAVVRKHVFDAMHGDTEFDSRPQILRDYDTAIADLKALRTRIQSGELAPDGTVHPDPDVSDLESKPRRFGTWFH